MTINFCNAKKNYLVCLLFFFGTPLLAFSEVIEKRNLETLKSDNSGNASVYVLSADGKIADGADDNSADDDSGWCDAVIWSGDKLGTKTILGMLENDNYVVVDASVYALSADGKIAAGVSDTDSGVKHAFISRISRSVPAPVEVPKPAPITPQAPQPAPIAPQAPQPAPITPQALQPLQ